MGVLSFARYYERRREMCTARPKNLAPVKLHALKKWP